MPLALDIPQSPGSRSALPPLDSGRGPLNKRQKAAIVVRLLLAEGARIPLDTLPDDLQAELARQMSEMRFVDRTTLSTVVEEFLGEIEQIGLAFPGGLEGALSMLDGTISAATASRLRQQTGLGLGDDPWARIARQEPPRLVDVLERESAEVAAVMLSKLEVGLAADLLGRLSGERARRITFAMSQTGAVSPAVVRKIGLAIAQQLETRPPVAFAARPGERVGAILNQSPSATRDDVLAGLDEEDADFAAEVRKTIFTYAHVPDRVAARDVPRIVRELPTSTLATLHAGGGEALAPTTEFILANMSKRLAETVREDAAGIGAPRAKDVEVAASAVVACIRELQTAGEITLSIEEED